MYIRGLSPRLAFSSASVDRSRFWIFSPCSFFCACSIDSSSAINGFWSWRDAVLGRAAPRELRLGGGGLAATQYTVGDYTWAGGKKLKIIVDTLV
jgi:hypothetical protein